MMTCQCGFIPCNHSTWWGWCSGGGWACVEGGARWEISVLDLQFCCELETALKMVINFKKFSFYLLLPSGWIRLYNRTFTVCETLIHTGTHTAQTPCIWAAKDRSSSQIIKSSLEELGNVSWRRSQNHLTELEPFSWLPTWASHTLILSAPCGCPRAWAVKNLLWATSLSEKHHESLERNIRFSVFLVTLKSESFQKICFSLIATHLGFV